MSDERDPQTHAILGAAMEVHTKLGCGFLEPPYQDAFEVELGLRNIPFEREVPIAISYKGKELKSTYKADFVCYNSVIVELKVVEALIDKHRSQVINYLKATGKHKALLLNFGAERLEYERVVLNYPDCICVHLRNLRGKKEF